MKSQKSTEIEYEGVWARALDSVAALDYNKNINALLTPFGPAGFLFA